MDYSYAVVTTFMGSMHSYGAHETAVTPNKILCIKPYYIYLLPSRTQIKYQCKQNTMTSRDLQFSDGKFWFLIRNRLPR